MKHTLTCYLVMQSLLGIKIDSRHQKGRSTIVLSTILLQDIFEFEARGLEEDLNRSYNIVHKVCLRRGVYFYSEQNLKKMNVLGGCQLP